MISRVLYMVLSYQKSYTLCSITRIGQTIPGGCIFRLFFMSKTTVEAMRMLWVLGCSPGRSFSRSPRCLVRGLARHWGFTTRDLTDFFASILGVALVSYTNARKTERNTSSPFLSPFILHSLPSVIPPPPPFDRNSIIQGRSFGVSGFN